MEKEYITISKEEYRILLKDSYELSLLKAYGVENWDGYSGVLKIKPDSELEKQ